jgi:thiol-disulfide isomerase/thioredoxin
MNSIRILTCLGALACLEALFLTTGLRAAEKSASTIWADLAQKREQLAGAYQEFEVSSTLKTQASTQASTRRVILDLAGRKWREQLVSGSGQYVRIFDGADTYWMEQGGNEFERLKPKGKEDTPEPEPYTNDADWMKAVEKERRPCGVTQFPHECVLLEAPMRAWSRGDPANSRRLLKGLVQVFIDTANGLILSRHSVELIARTRDQYQADTNYVLKKVGYGQAADASLFLPPSGDIKEVKTLSRWNAEKIRKQLGGKEAPELEAKDITGNPVALAAFKGKVVLLDFWTTWCPPCRADAPALDKLYRKYGDHDLMIVGVSVSEERDIVEKFLKQHPHEFPVVLTSENDMPRPYQIGVFPTYIVIERDGTIAAAAEGDQGFGELRKMLKKAGLEAE